MKHENINAAPKFFFIYFFFVVFLHFRPRPSPFLLRRQRTWRLEQQGVSRIKITTMNATNNGERAAVHLPRFESRERERKIVIYDHLSASDREAHITDVITRTPSISAVLGSPKTGATGRKKKRPKRNKKETKASKSDRTSSGALRPP